MKNKPTKKVQGFVGLSGLQFHVWRSYVVLGDDYYDELDNMELRFITGDDQEQLKEYASVDAAAEMFKANRGVWSHNSRLYIMSLYLDEYKLIDHDDKDPFKAREEGMIDLRDIDYDDCVRIFEFAATPDLIRAGSFKCILDSDTKWQSGFLTKNEALRLLEAYRECAPKPNFYDRDPAVLCDDKEMYYLSPSYVSMDAIKGIEAAQAGVGLLQDIIDTTHKDLPVETPDKMKFPAIITNIRQQRSCVVDIYDMVLDGMMKDIMFMDKEHSVKQFILEWAIERYATVAQWYIADIIFADDEYGKIIDKNWSVVCDFLDKEAFIKHVEKLCKQD